MAYQQPPMPPRPNPVPRRTAKQWEEYMRQQQAWIEAQQRLHGRVPLGLVDPIRYWLRGDGGPVEPGKAYLVGEKGPELLVSTAPGYVSTFSPVSSTDRRTVLAPPELTEQERKRLGYGQPDAGPRFDYKTSGTVPWGPSSARSREEDLLPYKERSAEEVRKRRAALEPYIPMSERTYPTPPPGAAGDDDAGPGTPAPYTRGSYQPLTPGQRAEEDKRSQARADYAKMVAWLKAKKAAEAQGLPIPDFRTFQVPSAAPGQPRETVEERVGKRPAPALDTRQYTPDDFTAGLEAEIRDRAGKTPQQVHEAALEAASARRQSLTLTPVEQQHNIAAAYVRDHDAALAQLKRAREITITMRKYPASTPKKDLDRAVENERAMEAVERKAWFEAQNALGAVRGLPAHPMPAREKETAMAAARRLGAAGKK